MTLAEALECWGRNNSARNKLIMDAMRAGMSGSETARHMGLSKTTVNNVRRNNYANRRPAAAAATAVVQDLDPGPVGERPTLS